MQKGTEKDECDETFNFPEFKPEDDIFLSLIHVALKVYGDMLHTPGHKGFSVKEEDAISCIPDSLYMFLRLLVGGTESLENDGSEENEDHICSKVLSIAQDIVYCVSGGKKWTHKHIGLASTLHQATRSKNLVSLFNKAGHCLSYDQVLQVDTALAESTLKSMDEETGTVIPPNMKENTFIHYTCDNIDILDDTIDGKNTFHAAQMASWQRGQGLDVALENLEVSSSRTLHVPNAIEKLHNVTSHSVRCEPMRPSLIIQNK